MQNRNSKTDTQTGKAAEAGRPGLIFGHRENIMKELLMNLGQKEQEEDQTVNHEAVVEEEGDNT